MSTINLSFPDQSYSSSNKPSVETLKADLLTIQDEENGKEERLSEVESDTTDALADIVELQAGWISAGETWTYASANTFTISGDKTGKYQVGDKIKLTQTSAKYFYVKAISYSAPNTTVTVMAGTDYTLANAAITSPYYSRANEPFGFPASFAWAPTFGGFATPPTIAARFRVIGKLAFVWGDNTVSGVSNATSLTITNLPFTPAQNQVFIVGQSMDNSIVLSQSGAATVTSGSATVTFFTTVGGATWTGSNNKYCNFFLCYIIS